MDNLINVSQEIQFTSAQWIFMLPLAFMLIDFISGFLKAWKNNEIDSSKMRKGLVKKLGEVLMLVVGELIVAGTMLPYSSDILKFISGYLCLMEAISIFENLALLGVPVPGFINRTLKQTAETIEKETINNENSGNGNSGDSTSSDQ
jgi:toxin secretion/phage lysis holin